MSTGGFAEEPELELGLPPRTDSRFLTGVQDGWHAIDAEPFKAASGCAKHAWSLCGILVRVAKDDYQPYDPSSVPVSYDPCPDCRWAIAAATDNFEAALAELRHPLAHDIAAMILNVASRDADEDVAWAEPDMLQLLATVSRHAPVSLFAEGCSEGDCDHDGDCPESLACRACSLQAGSWAGEWEGRYRSECTITAPCAVLLALAKHAGVTP